MAIKKGFELEAGNPDGGKKRSQQTFGQFETESTDGLKRNTAERKMLLKRKLDATLNSITTIKAKRGM